MRQACRGERTVGSKAGSSRNRTLLSVFFCRSMYEKAMKIRSLLLALVLFFAPALLRAEVRFSVSYSEAVDLFSLMDNVSEWEKGFTDPAYRAEWTDRFGWSERDQAMADLYSEYRNKTMINTPADGIFVSDNAVSDPLAAFFLTQSSVSGALRNLNLSMTPADADMLRRFYSHFAPKWQLLIRDNEALVDGATELNSLLSTDAVSAFVNRMSQFYGVETSGNFTIFFTRYPPGSKSSAHVVAGRYFLIHSPFGAEVIASEWDETVIHEFAHFVSMQQPIEQKQRLTAQFLAACPIPARIMPFWLLEEPLAVSWGQAAYSTKVKGRPLNPLSNWYSVPWIDLVSRAISPSVIAAYDNGTTINDGIVQEAADRCNNLTAISVQMSTALVN